MTRRPGGPVATGRPPTADDATDLATADALLDISRELMGITLRSVAAAPLSLTVPQHRVLLLIATDGARRVGVLASDLGVNQSNASRLVDRLVSQGLVRRAPDRADRRASLVTLTRQGEEVLRVVHEHRLAAVRALVARIPAADRATATAVLHELSAAARNADPGAPPGEE